MVKRVPPLPLKLPLLLLGAIAHHDLDLRAHDILQRDVHARVVIQPCAAVLTAPHDLGPKVEHALGVGLGAHELALKAHVADIEEVGERVPAEERLHLG